MIRLMLLLQLASTDGATEILVLSDGSRMDVASYEQRGNLIIVTTPEGALQSFPASLVNLEATRRANEGVPPGEGLAEAHLARARQALELYGTIEVLEFVSAQFLELVADELRDYAPERYQEPLLATARGTFSAPPMMDAMVKYLAENATEAQLDALVGKLLLPWLQRIVEHEKASSSYEGLEAEERYRERLSVSPPAPERRALIERIATANGSAEIGAQVYFTMLTTWEEVAKQFFPSAPMHDLVAFRDHFLRKGKNDRTGSLSTYRDATSEDLTEYAAFLESPQGQRFMRLFRSAFDAGLEVAYRETVTSWLATAASLKSL